MNLDVTFTGTAQAFPVTISQTKQVFSTGIDTTTQELASQLESGDSELDVEFEGEDLEIGFNVKYFTDIMRNLSDDRVKIGFNGGASACVLGPVEGQEYAFMVLPVRLHA